MKQYLEESSRTTAVLEEVRRDLFPRDIEFVNQLLAFIEVGITADLIKRSIFYNETQEKTKERNVAASSQLKQMALKLMLEHESKDSKIALTAKDIDIIHACLGIVSEVSEVLEELIQSKLEGRELDLTNLKEESGDLLWYQALLLRSVGSDFETEAERNINKLKARYPDKFNSEDALNRNLDNEKKVLAS